MPVSIFGKFQMVNVFQSANPTCMRYLFRIVDNTGVVYAILVVVWHFLGSAFSLAFKFAHKT